MISSLIHSMIVCPDMDYSYPRITYGKGVFLYDEHGKKYMDASSGSAGVTNLGHDTGAIADVMHAQVRKAAVLPTHAVSTEVLESYLSKLVAFAGHDFVRAWTVSSGTEAVENAVKLAYQYHVLNGEPDRYKVLARWSSYHGNSVFMLDVGGMRLRRDTYARWMNNFPHLSPAYKYRKPEGMTDDEYISMLIKELEDTILENDPATIAAFVLEPVVAAALGAVPPPDSRYIKEVRALCDRYGILLIADEVLTGFGRLGANFGMDKWNTAPDIIAAGKGISAGYYPLSAIIANRKVARPFEEQKVPFLGGHTFACSPLGAAIGSYVIDYMEKERVVENAAEAGRYLSTLLKKELLPFDIVGDVRGEGLLQGIELVKDKTTKQPFPPELLLSKKIGQRCIQKGVILYPGRGSAGNNTGDHIMICPPLISSHAHMEELVAVLAESVQEEMERVLVAPGL
ncbi:aspartate aminotransferase family protein [Chitinophaga varians]|uniref:Aspartate aminotransferase family protein n=1 Tax=Chitinophaga varians TaxID=2202339 RepID=A0A847RS62_9BACT|nr:aminotransferase class III-fold pyridoxal phosphate-dependent enzyme [Chitinophaga varians]NLR68490.1 aspartate aminotransferase family protein [Chitinophaga varians]